MRRIGSKTRLPAAQPRPAEAEMRAPRKPALRRRPAPPRWRRQVWRTAGFACLLLVVGGSGFYTWHARLPTMAWGHVRDGFVAGTADLGMTLREIKVDGREHTPKDELLASLGVHLDQPMMTIDPQALKAQLESLGWVRSATVERRLPGTLYVRLVEAEPVALWQHDGAFRLIDRSGQTIDKADAAMFANLPVLVGDGAPAHCADLLAMLAREPDLAARVRGAVWVSERRWNLRFDNGVDAKLPADSPEAAWSLLAKLEREQHLLARDITVIDLRLPDRLVVKVGPAVDVLHPDQAKQPGSST